jgi:hypothetical protein
MKKDEEIQSAIAIICRNLYAQAVFPRQAEEEILSALREVRKDENEANIKACENLAEGFRALSHSDESHEETRAQGCGDCASAIRARLREVKG